MSKLAGKRRADGGAVIVTNGNFANDVLNADRPVLLDLWVPWCDPCKTLEPIVNSAVERYSGRILLASANVDDAPSLRKRLGLVVLPTLILFAHGREVARMTGLCDNEDLDEFVRRALEEYGS